MALELGSIEPDESLIASGVWKDYGEPEEGARLLIGYARGKEFQSKVAKLTDTAMQQTKGRRLEPHVIRNINRRAMAGTLLRDWEKITVDGGKELPRDPKNMEASLLRLLSNDLLYEFVQEQSSMLINFRQESEAAAKAEGKSGAPVES